MGYTFEWDPAKAESNIRKHGVSFDEVAGAFGDPLALLMPDPGHSAAEERYVLLGRSLRGRLLVVCFGERGARTRLVSARPATRRERKRYEEEP